MKNRKSAIRLLILNWSKFPVLDIKLEGSTLVTGVNGTGKSTILDAMTYLLTANTQFNKAAKDKDRNVKSYVRGDTKSNGPDKYLRHGDVTSYIAMEFETPDDKNMVIAVCIESREDSDPSSYWFVINDAHITDINFYEKHGKELTVFPKEKLSVHGKKIDRKIFMGREKGVAQILRALGIRNVECNKYKNKLVKMMAFDPQANIDKFIRESVLEPGEITSLQSLREHRDNYDRIRQEYDDMVNSKELLESIMTCIENYENTLKEYNKRNLMYLFQNWQCEIDVLNDIEKRMNKYDQELKMVEKKLIDNEVAKKKADERLYQAKNNDVYRGMEDTIHKLNDEKEEAEQKLNGYDSDISKLEMLRVNVKNLLDVVKKQYMEVSESLNAFINISKEEGTKAGSSYIDIVDKISELEDEEKKKYYQYAGELKTIEELLSNLMLQKKKLEANQLVFPEEAERDKEFLQVELKKLGIETEVKFFAEYVAKLKDERWRKAIETFLGNKRLNLIVDGQYCLEALKIVNENKELSCKVIVTDKLEETEIKTGSAAELLEITNPYARKYANYLLNGIHLCDNVEELHNYPKGGLMVNGMLAKSYAVSKMSLQRTRLYLGNDAIRHQLNQVVLEIERQQKQKIDLVEKQRVNDEILEYARRIPRQSDYYNFMAYSDKNAQNRRIAEISVQIKELTNTPGFLAIQAELDNAEKEVKYANEERDKLSREKGSIETNICNSARDIEDSKLRIEANKNQFDEVVVKNLELKNAVINEYTEERKRKNKNIVIAWKTVRDWESKVDNSRKELEDNQLEYLKIIGGNLNERGISYIPRFREDYRQLANVKIDEARANLQKQGEKLQMAFIRDFVGELNETISRAKEEIFLLNRELRQLPFGSDTYEFKMNPRNDRKVFFNICEQMNKYINNADLYLNNIKDDEAAERDIKDFLEMVLEEEDETEYTDYRKYFVYDMTIRSQKGASVSEADLSKKQGSASNGEKQTPYFIILAASLRQCYPKDRVCARLAFIDEAFSALSRERIEQMVKYLEDNNFQVIYAAPPEKISSIGSYIESTISLIETGRYTQAVEGILKNE